MFFLNFSGFLSLTYKKVGILNTKNQTPTKTFILLIPSEFISGKEYNDKNKADRPPKNPKPQAKPEILRCFLFDLSQVNKNLKIHIPFRMIYSLSQI